MHFESKQQEMFNCIVYTDDVVLTVLRVYENWYKYWKNCDSDRKKILFSLLQIYIFPCNSKWR